MYLKELANLIAKDAPILGSVVSIFNPLLGTVIASIGKAFNADPNNLDDIASKIATDPDAKMKLKQLEIEHQDAIYKLQVSDRESAREREEKIVELTGKRDWVIDVIAIFVIFGFFIMCILVGSGKFDQSDHDILYMLIGQLSAGFLMIVSYYFGSSNKSG
jgi:hypothetical protein